MIDTIRTQPEIANLHIEWHHGDMAYIEAEILDDGTLDLDSIAAALCSGDHLPPLIRRVYAETTMDDPWVLQIIDADTDDSLAVAYVEHGAGA